MKKTVTLDSFLDSFKEDGFEYHYFGGADGLTALYEFLLELERDTGAKIDLDASTIRRDFEHFMDLADYNDLHKTDYADEYDIEYLACTIPGTHAFITYAH